MKQRTNNVVVGVALGMVAGFAALDARADVPQGPRGVACWGSNSYSQCNLPTGLGPVQMFAAGWYHSVALKLDGTVACWGYNMGHGECSVPAGLSSVTAISAGYGFAAALKADGTVTCWGDNSYGQCSVPAGLSSVISVAAGGGHMVSLRSDGSAACWGYNAYGECNVPAGLPAVTAIAAGGYHTVALKSDGTLTCWGENSAGQCNPGGLASVAAIAAGWYHNVALRVDGSVACWGQNGNSACNVPEGLPVVRAVAAGSSHTMALTVDGTVKCWGWNGSGECNVPASLQATSVVGGNSSSFALSLGAALNARTNAVFSLLAPGILDALSGDTLYIAPWAADDETVDYRGKSIELRSTNAIARGAASTTLFADGARLTAPESIALAGASNIPTNASVNIAAGNGLSFGGFTVIAVGGSVLADSGAGALTIDGVVALGANSTFTALSEPQINTGATLQVLGGAVISGGLSTNAGSNLVAVGGTISTGTLDIGGHVSSLDSTIVAGTTTEAAGEISASGQLIGNLTNNGRVITAADLLLSGNLQNNAGGKVIAQLGTLYVTGSVVNNGSIYGNVVNAPNYTGGGTQPGDGISIAGSLTLGAGSELRFIEDLWKFSVCGDVSLACTSDNVRFNGAKLSLDGCNGTVQTVEATSRDLGCVAGAFSGAETQVSLIGELEVASGATVQLVDNFNNAPGKTAEVVYARGLTVQPGATLITNGIKVVTRNALIQGTVDNMANICVVVDAPDPDVNGDGHVNAIDLAFILTYWGTSAPIADLNRDGFVGAPDMSIVLNGWTWNS